MSPERYLKWMLRLFGGVTVLAIFGFFLPYGWMQEIHKLIGLGELPKMPVIDYLARATSGMFAFFGALILMTSVDVRKYAGVITFVAISILFLAVFGGYHALRAGLPPWWILGDVTACVVSGTLILYLQRRIKNDG